MDLVSMVKQKFVGGSNGSKVVLEIDLARGVLVAPPTNPMAALKAMNAPSMKALRERLREAATDDDVLGLVVHLGESGLGLAQAQELALAIAAFGEHKPTLGFSESFGEFANALPTYLVGAHCQELWMQPSGELGIGGVHVGITLLKGALGKLGVDPQFSQRHEYKTAGDQFSADHVTEPNREMMQALANSLAHRFVAIVAERRGLGEQQVWDAVDNSPLTPQQALDRGLVDQLGYRDQAMAHALKTWDAEVEQLRFVHRWNSRNPAEQMAHDLVQRKQPTLAVVSLRGGIVSGRGRPGGMSGQGDTGADVVCESLRAAQRDDKVKAVVLHVDSPGGSAVASDSIWRAVHQLREAGKPVVAQMGTYAASGGYYVSMAADEIVALPATLTGSIGVVGGKFVTRRTYEKLGLVHEGIDSGRNAGMMASDEWFTDEQWERFHASLDRIYADFTSKAAQDRSMPLEQLEPIARGRVWTGADALDRRLVDHLGGMDLAIDRACELAGLTRSRTHVRPYPALGPLDQFRPATSTESVGGQGAEALAATLDGSTGFERLLALAANRLGVRIDGFLTAPLLAPAIQLG
ncbi:signal peptide peptidase SppA [Luteococcus peritonei]|uniref:Signal peptide peptidase SppA n=1 Tax=Luteococcus peritonei TaxID=88874 RepID=A0ABW4S0B1_9ACTN